MRITKGPGYNWRPIGRPMASTLRIVPKTTRAACSLYLRLAVKGWPEKSRLSGTTLAGPHGSQILFQNYFFITYLTDRFYVVGLDGGAPRQVFADFVSHQNLRAISAAWHPDGQRISMWG